MTDSHKHLGVCVLPDGTRLYGLDAELYFKAEAARDRGAEGELAKWIETVLDQPLPDREDLWVSFKSGVVLCQLVNKIKPGAIPAFHEAKLNAFYERENIQHFLQACWHFGIPSSSMFTASDLQSGRAMRQVILAVEKLGQLAPELGYTGPIFKPRKISSQYDGKKWSVSSPPTNNRRVEDLEAEQGRDSEVLVATLNSELRKLKADNAALSQQLSAVQTPRTTPRLSTRLRLSAQSSSMSEDTGMTGLGPVEVVVGEGDPTLDGGGMMYYRSSPDQGLSKQALADMQKNLDAIIWQQDPEDEEGESDGHSHDDKGDFIKRLGELQELAKMLHSEAGRRTFAFSVTRTLRQMDNEVKIFVESCLVDTPFLLENNDKSFAPVDISLNLHAGTFKVGTRTIPLSSIIDVKRRPPTTILSNPMFGFMVVLDKTGSGIHLLTQTETLRDRWTRGLKASLSRVGGSALNIKTRDELHPQTLKVLAAKAKFMPEEKLIVLWSHKNQFSPPLDFVGDALVAITTRRVLKIQEDKMREVSRSQVAKVEHIKSSMFRWDKVGLSLRSGEEAAFGMSSREATKFFCDVLTGNVHPQDSPLCLSQDNFQSVLYLFNIALREASEAKNKDWICTRMLMEAAVRVTCFMEETDSRRSSRISKDMDGITSVPSTPRSLVSPPLQQNPSTENKPKKMKKIQDFVRGYVGHEPMQFWEDYFWAKVTATHSDGTVEGAKDAMVVPATPRLGGGGGDATPRTSWVGTGGVGVGSEGEGRGPMVPASPVGMGPRVWTTTVSNPSWLVPFIEGFVGDMVEWGCNAEVCTAVVEAVHRASTLEDIVLKSLLVSIKFLFPTSNSLQTSVGGRSQSLIHVAPRKSPTTPRDSLILTSTSRTSSSSNSGPFSSVNDSKANPSLTPKVSPALPTSTIASPAIKSSPPELNRSSSSLNPGIAQPASTLPVSSVNVSGVQARIQSLQAATNPNPVANSLPASGKSSQGINSNATDAPSKPQQALLSCATCGTQRKEGAKFCIQCGTPAPTQPTQPQPAATVAQPVSSKPATAQPIKAQAVATQPVDAKPVATQPAAAKPVATQPVAVPTQPIVTKPAGTTKPATNQPATTLPATAKPSQANAPQPTTQPVATVQSQVSMKPVGGQPMPQDKQTASIPSKAVAAQTVQPKVATLPTMPDQPKPVVGQPVTPQKSTTSVRPNTEVRANATSTSDSSPASQNPAPLILSPARTERQGSVFASTGLRSARGTGTGFLASPDSSPAKVACTACGYPSAQGKFCPGCGKPLPGASPAKSE